MRVKQLSAMVLAVIVCGTTSACGQPERPRTVSDSFCLTDKRLSAEPAPGPDAMDHGNKWDTDATLAEILAHNEVFDRLCPD